MDLDASKAVDIQHSEAAKMGKESTTTTNVRREKRRKQTKISRCVPENSSMRDPFEEEIAMLASGENSFIIFVIFSFI